MCLFDYNKQDLAAFLKHKRKQKQYANMTDRQILNSLALSALRRHVRRHYISGAQQAERLQGWYALYLSDAAKAVDPVTGRHILAGSFKAFETVFENQLALARDGYLSGEVWADRVRMGGDGMAKVRAGKPHKGHGRAAHTICPRGLATDWSHLSEFYGTVPLLKPLVAN